ncbi:MAG: ergothioneine biosynthesis protein EgtB, partial [Flavobacteriales bacterium]
MIDQYHSVRISTEEICAPLKPEDYHTQVVLHASPAVWQLGHVTWFFEEFILSKYHEDYQPYRDDCSFIFNSYYNNVGDRTKRDERDKIDFSIEEVYHYR